MVYALSLFILICVGELSLFLDRRRSFEFNMATSTSRFNFHSSFSQDCITISLDLERDLILDGKLFLIVFFLQWCPHFKNFSSFKNLL